MRRYKRVKMKPPWLQRGFVKTILRKATSSKFKWEILYIIAPVIVCVVLLSIDTNCDPTGSSSADEPEIGSPAPRFAQSQDSTVIASIYQNEVYLPCKILDLDEEQTVSWIRKRDSLVLTINKLRLIDDNRFQLTQTNDDWTLMIRQPIDSDAGFYECQVSSLEPKLSHSIELRLVKAESMISNLSSLFVRPNDTVNLTCTIFAPQPTKYVYWYKNSKEFVQFDNNLVQQHHLKLNTESTSGDGNELLLTRRVRRSSVYDSRQEPGIGATRRLGAPSTGKKRDRRHTSGRRDKVVTLVNDVFVARAGNGDKGNKDDEMGTIRSKKRPKTDVSESSFATNLKRAKVKLNAGAESHNELGQIKRQDYAITRRTGAGNNNERAKSEMNRKSSESMPSRELKLNSKEQEERDEGGEEEAGEESEQDNNNSSNNNNSSSDNNNYNKLLQQQQHFLVHSSSSLIIKQAQLNDTANYTCSNRRF